MEVEVVPHAAIAASIISPENIATLALGNNLAIYKDEIMLHSSPKLIASYIYGQYPGHYLDNRSKSIASDKITKVPELNAF